MSKKTALALALAFHLMLPAIAEAHVTWECGGEKLEWNATPTVMRAASISFPSNHPYTWALGSAIASWNVNPSQQAFFLYLGDATVAFDNGENEIWWSSDEALIGDAKGITFWWWDCGAGEITEADVVFNVNLDWTSSSSKVLHQTYGGSFIPFDAIAVHELGHAMGLGHEDRTYTIMNAWAHSHANGNPSHAYPGEDAVQGMVYLYGADPGRPQDLAVAHWRQISVPGVGNMGHYRTVVYDHETSDWQQLLETVDGFTAWRDTESEPRFKVYNGQTIWPEFTYENNGSDQQTVSADFYLSEDDFISTDDRSLGGTSLRLSPDIVFTKALSVTLPSDLEEGADYELGVMLDRDDDVDEFVAEGNNTAYVGIRIERTFPIAVTFNPLYVDGGQTTVGTVTLKGTAPEGGVEISLFAADPYVSIPASTTVAAGTRSGTFDVQTTSVPTVSYAVEISASRSGVTGTATGTLHIRSLVTAAPLQICDVLGNSALCQLCRELPPAESFCREFFRR